MPRKATDNDLATFVAENLSNAPVEKRAGLCRRIAELFCDQEISARFVAQAECLEEIAADHSQLLLNLRGKERAR